jgi:hypothetical protein
VSEGVAVTLTRQEALQAAYGGVHRRLRAIFRGRQHRYGRGDGDAWQADVDACGAEIATAIAVDRHWGDDPEPDYLGDVGSRSPKLHVRHSVRPDGRLILREDDPDDAVFVLVTGTIPAFRVCGWITGREGKAGDLIDLNNNRPPCWMVPQSELRPIEELQR